MLFVYNATLNKALSYLFLPHISAPPTPALYLSMDRISGSVLVPDFGNIQGTLENAPSLVPNAIRGKALKLDGVNQAVNLGNQRHRCLGEESALSEY